MQERVSGAGSLDDRAEHVPESALAVQLIYQLRECGKDGGLIHVARSEARALRIQRALAGLAPDLKTLVMPPWDCLPHDRSPPSREVMGRRVAALMHLAGSVPANPLVLTTADALMQRVPPRDVWSGTRRELHVGASLDLTELEEFLLRSGYALDDRVDEPGEAALRGAVIDLFAAGFESPCRIEHAEGRITAIRFYDPISQRTVSEITVLPLIPTSEAVWPGAPADAAFLGTDEPSPQAGTSYPPSRMQTLFDYLPHAVFRFDAEAESRRRAFAELLADAPSDRDARRSSDLYLDEAEWRERLAERRILGVPDGLWQDVPRFATHAKPLDEVTRYLQEHRAAGRPVILAAPTGADLDMLSRRLRSRADVQIVKAEGWEDALRSPRDIVPALIADIAAGFEASEAVLITAADILGAQAARSSSASAASLLLRGDTRFQLGDTVVHMDHGIGILQGLETVAVDGTETEAVRLEYAGGATLLVPPADMSRIWRYSGEAGAVTLDRLDGTSWPKRRAEVEAQIAETAAHLVRMAQERASLEAPVITPPRVAYERFVARFPFAETPDQERAIAEVLADLASGRPMDRLVCGDVGFGKTEVALRAAAAVALSGRQVAVVVPTTVLARQHVSTFRRRFAGFGIEIGQLSRLSTPKEQADIKKGLADGRIRLAIGTHAIGSRTVRFADLALLIVDEEQRFGVRQKSNLRRLGDGVHRLTFSATPIPRTLQAAMAGLQDISIIATPPVRRQPVRTLLSSFDPIQVREALRRERRRGGQSFVVCPRVEDIEPMRAKLLDLIPDLNLLVAHGKQPPKEIDDVMVRFADGDGDVLLSTSIIESGLDVPRANTMLVWRADRFGLAQLHQIRGRVGRGRTRGTVYLLTEPDKPIPAVTEKRLRTLQASTGWEPVLPSAPATWTCAAPAICWAKHRPVT